MISCFAPSNMQFQKSLILTLFILLTGYCNLVYGQSPSKKVIQKDTSNSHKDFVTKMQDFAQASSIKSRADLEADKAEQIQEATFVEIKKNLQNAKFYFRSSLDTNAVKGELLLIIKYAKQVGDGVSAQKGTVRTYRNLVTAEKILRTLLGRCLLQKNKLDNHRKRLSNFKYQIDSLASTKQLFRFSSDSVKLSKYMQTLFVLAKEVAPVNQVIDRSILQTQSLQNQADLLNYSLKNNLDEIELYQREMSNHLFKKEFPFIWESMGSLKSFKQTIIYSLEKGKLNLWFFSNSNISILFGALLLSAICYFFILSLKKAYLEDMNKEAFSEVNLILKHPLVSAIFIISNLAQFLFNEPPFIFNLFFWLISGISLAFLMKGYVSKFWMGSWLLMLSLFVLAALDNLILLPSVIERWYMLILSLAGVISGLLMFKLGKRDELRERFIVYAIGMMSVLEICSLSFNIYGSYNLAKALLVAGYVNVIIGIMFLWTVRLINQGLQLAYNLYARQDKSLFFMNFDRVGQKAPALLYILLVIGWLILFGRNFPAYTFAIEPVRTFLFEQRTLGSYSFSIINLILFFFIVSTAVVISKIVSFFAVDKRTFSRHQNDKRGIGSWILLIRITIILLGLFLAFAAVGIPIDKIAIVLGALGVGIGFGLQSLVNNLVSGLVIAFEKPVNLDDEVEVAGKSGTVKTIGFRSSVITTFDGAEIVLPNGDLLNSHMVNWSSGGNKRRSSIVINVSHNANLQLVKEEIKNILSADDRILKHPEPTAFFQAIHAEGLELHLFYWTKQSKLLLEIRNDVILSINQLFAKHGIKIPYPTQEVFIHNVAKKDNKV